MKIKGKVHCLICSEMGRTKTKGRDTHSEATALIEDLGLEIDMISVELDSECAAELALGGLLHARTDETNI